MLFADVSGFTAMSETIDAEEVAGFINAFWALVDASITGHRGRIDKHIGDAVMALWGADRAREDDPEWAVRAALAIRAAVATFCTTHSLPLAMRVGVNTGPVVFGAVGTTLKLGDVAAARHGAREALLLARSLGSLPALVFTVYLCSVPGLIIAVWTSSPALKSPRG